MTRPTIITFSLALCCHAAETKEDFLSFTNGDQLHGHFAGMAEDATLVWKRDDVGAEVKFKTDELRRVVLHGGEPLNALRGFSHIGTTNGDRIPGEIREIDDKRVIIDTEFGGMMEFPREHVGLLAPSPLGGRILYHGPFEAAQWEMINTAYPDGLPAPPAEGEKKEAKGDGPPRWKHRGAAWYWKNDETGTALARKTGMPDKAVLRFDVAWKSRLSLAVSFHADFFKPEEVDAGNQVGMAMAGASRSVSLPEIFGNSYVLHMYSNYVMLYRTSFDAAGRPRLDRLQTSNSSLRLGDAGKASVEIRCNRISGEISLFVDGEFVSQWSELGGGIEEGQGYAGKGDGFGFVAQSEGASMKLSEIIVSEWNGMPDSARSMQVDDADIVLLANGTDRFSGKVTGFHEGILKLEGRFGNFEFPIAEVAEVRFSKSGLAVAEASPSAEIRLRFHPMGRISGKALGGDASSLRLRSAHAGDIDVKLGSAVMLEFGDNESFLDDWDDEF
ncbi:hypothetical protein HZ994_17325 [Akkermansiaceae bacterium]|nr:hypothetical protein HZ994_17325 [Akkermansiaceae bacterium]